MDPRKFGSGTTPKCHGSITLLFILFPNLSVGLPFNPPPKQVISIWFTSLSVSLSTRQIVFFLSKQNKLREISDIFYFDAKKWDSFDLKQNSEAK
jgi:hypothetical protein